MSAVPPIDAGDLVPIRHADAALVERIENDFKQRTGTGSQPGTVQLLTRHTRGLAQLYARECPPSRELSSALTRLEEALFHASEAITRNPQEKS